MSEQRPEGTGAPDAHAAPTAAPADARPAGSSAAAEPIAYQAAQKASPWGYVFLLGIAGLLTGIAWYRVEEQTGVVTQVWIFLAALLTLAPIAWHAVDFFQSVASRRGGAFLNVALTVLFGTFLMVVVSALNIVRKETLPAVDLTENQRYTLGEETLKILDRVRNEGTVYATYLQRPGAADSLRQMAIEQLRVYAFQSPSVVVEVFDDTREKERAEKYLRSVGVVSTSSGEQNDVIVLSFAAKGREVAVGRQKEIVVQEYSFATKSAATNQPQWLGERVITSGIQELVFTKLKAYATGGHGERGLSDQMRGLRERLVSQNVEVDPKVLDLATQPEVPADCDLLLVLGPETPFQANEVAALQKWLDAGKALFVTLDSDTSGKRRETGLEPLFDRFGIAPRINYLVIAPRLLDVGGGQGVAVKMTPELIVTSREYAAHPSVEALRRGGGFATYFLNSSYLEVDTEGKPDVTVEPVVWAPDPGIKDVPRPWAARMSATRREISAPDPSTDKTGVRLPLLVAAKREILANGGDAKKADARLVVSGDTDAFDDQITSRNAPNLDLFGGLTQWALRREDLVAVSEKTMEIEIATIDDRDHRMAFWWPLVTALSALLAGAAVWWGRRR